MTLNRNTLPDGDTRKTQATQCKGTRASGEVRIRTCDDAALFDALNTSQVRAFERLYKGHNIYLTGLPVAKMRYDDMPKCAPCDWGPEKIELARNYLAWHEKTKYTRQNAAVMARITEPWTLAEIAKNIGVGTQRGKNCRVTALIQDGLDAYVKLMGWGEYNAAEGAILAKVSEYPSQMPSYSAQGVP